MTTRPRLLIQNISRYTIHILGIKINPSEVLDLYEHIDTGSYNLTSAVLNAMEAPHGQIYYEQEVKGRINVLEFYNPIYGTNGAGTATENVTASQSSLTATEGKVILFCDASTGAQIISLPSAINNTASIIVKKIDQTINSMTITPILSQTIDGASSYSFSIPMTSVTLVSNNSNWYIT